MVEKLGLTTQLHTCPCYIQWINSCDKIKVNIIACIEFSINTYKDSADINLIPMQACSLLLDKPWIYANNVPHNTIANNTCSNTIVA